MIYTLYRNGVAIGQIACPPGQLEQNVPEGCEAREGGASTEQTPDLAAEIRALAREEIDRLERAKVRALTDHVLAPSAEIEIGGRRMLPKDRVSELEAAIVEQRKRL